MRVDFLIGILLLTCVFCLGRCYTNSAEEAVHLIPNGYRGTIFIIFDSPRGEHTKYEKEKRLYDIPLSGVLRTQFSKNDGWAAPPQYCYRNSELRIPVKQAGIEVTGFQVGIYTSSDGKQISYASYIVGKPSELDSLYQFREKMNLDSLFLN